jgi:hypothetical protein
LKRNLTREDKMRLFPGISIISLWISLAPLIGSTAFAAPPPESAQSRACWAKADQQSLTGQSRADFHATCMKGAGTPPGPAANPREHSAWAKAVTEPSGADRATRSRQCSAEADRRGLVSAKRQAFRQDCIASAAPVNANGTATHAPTPTPAKEAVDHGGGPPTR